MTQSQMVCSSCSAPLRPEDFDRGQAVTLLRRHYCRKCMDEAVRKSRETAGPADMFLTPRPNPPSPPKQRP